MTTSELTVRRKVEKRQPRRAEPPPATRARIPRISRLMALAIRFDEMLRDGEVESLAQLAAIGRVSRARLSQIMALNNLAPSIQEALLFLPATDGAETVTERQMRPAAATVDWSEQDRLWDDLTAR